MTYTTAYAARPAAARRAPRKVSPASDKQLALIFKLNGEKDTTRLAGVEALTLASIRNGHEVSSREASSLIDSMFGLSRKIDPAAPKAEPGYYVRTEAGGEDTDGEPVEVFYVVVQNQAKTSTYAKRLTLDLDDAGRKRASWVYAPGVGKNIAKEGLTNLTIEVAAKFGHLHGICFKCCKPLTDPKSVMAGMGPICRKALG